MSVLKEFKQFAISGNVVDMAVGIIIGSAFGKIVSSLVSDVIMPPIGVLLGGVDFSNLKIIIKEATESSSAISINYGIFINSVIDFIIIALAIFVVVKQINKLKEKLIEQPIEETKIQEPTEDILLLREIRDGLKNKSNE